MCWHISVSSMWWCWWRVTLQKAERTEKASSFFFTHCLVSLCLHHHVVRTLKQPWEDCCYNSGLNHLRTLWPSSAFCCPAATMVQQIHMVCSPFTTIQWVGCFPTYDLLDLTRWKMCTVFSPMLLGKTVVTSTGAMASRGEGAITERDWTLRLSEPLKVQGIEVCIGFPGALHITASQVRDLLHCSELLSWWINTVIPSCFCIN